jgi:porphobilinogen synthase
MTATDYLRLRRLRSTENMRALVNETTLDPSDFIAPIFVRYGRGVVEPIGALPGVNRYSVDRVADYSAHLAELGIKAVLLFGIPETKDDIGTGAYAEDGVVPLAIREIKKTTPSMLVVADVCLCEYSSHGHCGVIRDGQVDNDETLPLMGKAAVAYARAGADVVAPSAMMDFQVRALRGALNTEGLQKTLIMGYSAKFASSFYGPFREAAGSTPSFGDRKGYQMPPGNGREALREIESDIDEGADIVMVKPALPYLDIITKARAKFDVPIAAYNVSGEYAMVKAAAANGWLDESAVSFEVLTSIKRAGADLIITYFAEEAAARLRRSP